MDGMYDGRRVLGVIGTVLGLMVALTLVLCLFNEHRVEWWLIVIQFSAAVVSTLIAVMGVVLWFGKYL